ncbi:heparinase II/III family protein [Ruoffia sp. FAM 26254]|uniref:heparinase II/III domain-containing protein n=1 Tax=Ruoffia sp. FAM 26254 TaxID=3259518 RepID=UPI00388375C7
MIKSVLSEYGIPWVFNRTLYATKLGLMKKIPTTEKLYEKKVNIKRTDIFNFNIKEIEQFLKKLPDDNKQEIINIADAAIEGKIKGFSSIELDYGNPINWHLNPITGVQVDSKTKWYEIPDFDPERGDIKIVWEASRFTHFFSFVRAFMLTKELKYYRAFSEQLNNWLINNQYSYGANYKCSQETTLRMIGGLFSYSVFEAYEVTTAKDEKNITKLISDSYKKVLSNFFYAHKCIKNNHTLTEILGLIIGAWCCQDDKALLKAYNLMDEEIAKQFMPDGGYIQYSFNYQRFALQIMEMLLKINIKTTKTLSKKSESLILKSSLLLYHLQDESGVMPNYGSNDGALIFPLSSSTYRDFRPVINTIHSLINNERLYQSDIYDEEILWFTKNNIDDLPIVDIQRESLAFENAGFYSLRHQNGFLMTILSDYKTRPAQMDQMHIDLWHKGLNIFCDSGTYSYASKLGQELSLTAAHNTVKIENIEQMNKRGPFFIYDWTERSSVQFKKSYFKGVMKSQNSYLHEREITLKNSVYNIIDHISGTNKNFEIIFNTPFDIEYIDNGINLIHGKQIIAQVITEGSIESTKTYRSLYYLQKEEVNKIIIRSDKNIIKTKVILNDKINT